MARVDSRKRQIQAKLVYYGPGLCGKTTNLEYLSRTVASDQEMMSLATEGDRTIFFDFFPLELGKIRGMDTSFKLYTVPGQVRYNQTRQMVLKNVDGIIFVADSQPAMMDANLESLDNLFSNLAELRIKRETVSLVLQYNKRDLPGVLPPEALDKELNSAGYPRFLASAVTGEGVVDTLKSACTLVIRRLSDSFGDPRAAAAESGTSERVRSAMPGSSKPRERTAAPRHAAEKKSKTRQQPEQAAQAPRARAPARRTKPSKEPQQTPRDTTKHESAKQAKVAAGSQRIPATAIPVVREPASHSALDALAKSVTSTLEEHRAALADFMEKRVAVEKSLSTDLERIKSLTRDLPSKSDLAAVRNAVEKLNDAEQTRMALLKADLKKHRLQQEHLEDLCERLADKLTAAVPAGAASSGVNMKALAADLTRDLATKSDVTELVAKATGPGDSSLDVSNLPSKGDFETLGDTLGKKLDELATKAAARNGETLDVRALKEELMRDLPSWSPDTDALRGEMASVLERATNDLPRRSDFEALQTQVAHLTEQMNSASAAQLSMADLDKRMSRRGEHIARQLDELRDQTLAAIRDSAANVAAPAAVTAEQAPEAAEPEAAEPEATEPEATEPEATEPEATEPEATEPEATEPEAPDAEAPDAEAPDAEAASDEPTQAAAGSEEAELTDDPRHQNAARIARVMISDLYLYHQQEVDDGIRNGDFFERNKEALDDMRSTYDSRLDEDVRSCKDHLGPAIESFIARKRKHLGLE